MLNRRARLTIVAPTKPEYGPDVKSYEQTIQQGGEEKTAAGLREAAESGCESQAPGQGEGLSRRLSIPPFAPRWPQGWRGHFCFEIEICFLDPVSPCTKKVGRREEMDWPVSTKTLVAQSRLLALLPGAAPVLRWQRNC